MFQLTITLASLLLIALLAAMAFLRRPTREEPHTERDPVPPEDRIRRMALRSSVQGSLPLRAEKHLLRELKWVAAQDQPLPAARMASRHVRELALLCLRVREGVKRRLRLPADQHGEIRMQRLCTTLIEEHGAVTADQLKDALDRWQSAAGTTLRERKLLPLCMQLTLTQLLSQTLQELKQEAQDRQLGHSLAGALPRSRHPERVLRRVRFSPACVHALLTSLRDTAHADLIGSVEKLLEDAGASPRRADELFAQQQELLAQRIGNILSTAESLQQAEWPTMIEDMDPLHEILLRDPAHLYGRMDAPSRDLYREEAAWAARLFAVEESRLATACLQLASSSPADGLHDHVGFYLLESEGLRKLHRHLRAPRGRLRLLFVARQETLLRAILSAGALAAALCYLNAGHPLWTLPFFLGVTAAFSRAFLHFARERLFHQPKSPRLQIDNITDRERTLIVLHVTLRDPAHAVKAVRELLLAREACPDGAIDCLLLADLPEHPTVAATSDAATIAAAEDALQAVSTDKRAFYLLQRRRIWLPERGVHAGRGGRRGALESLDRLICEGTCEDAFDRATLSPAELYRRYAYVLHIERGARLAPDSLPAMMGALSHPLNQRQETATGWRGASMLCPHAKTDPLRARTVASMQFAPVSGGCTLYRPDARLAATQELPLAGTPPELEYALAGRIILDDVPVYVSPVNTDAPLYQAAHRARASVALLPWLLPWIRSGRGVVRNPLSRSSAAMLRDYLKQAALPLCQAVMLLYGVLSRSEPVTLLAAFPPCFCTPLRLPAAFAALSLLPQRLLLSLDSALRFLFPSTPPLPADTDATEILTQAIAAIALAGASLVPFPPSWTGIAVSALFGAYPLLLRWLNSPAAPVSALTEPAVASLTDAARATWRFFMETVVPETRFLPPDSWQEEPWKGAEPCASARGIGLYLLGCVSAHDAALCDTSTFARLLADTTATLEQLPMWHGLPAVRYKLPELSPLEGVNSADCGVFCAGLLCAAQALRACLQELPPEHATLSSRLDAIASRMELSRLYDQRKGLFVKRISLPEGEPSRDVHSLLASDSLLLSFLAVMHREVPDTHWKRLSALPVALRRRKALLSEHGSAADLLLPALLLPFPPHTLQGRLLRGMLREQQRSTQMGVFGVSESCCWSFDAQMRYRQQPFGLPALALRDAPPHAVVTPYASALMLPFLPAEAADNLDRLRALSMFGRYGFFDALDATPAHLPAGSDRAIVRTWTAAHQAMLLCGLCSAITPGALQRHFLAIPGAEAHLPAMWAFSPDAPALPQRLLHPQTSAPQEASFVRQADPYVLPVEAHVLCGGGSTMVISAQGGGFLRTGGVTLTRFTGEFLREGPRFFVLDGSESLDPADPTLPGETLFEEGCARFLRQSAELSVALTVTVDPLSGAFLHVLEVSNLSARERMIEAFSLLEPAEDAQPVAVHTRPDELRVRLGDGFLVHSASADSGFVRLSAAAHTREIPGYAKAVSRPCLSFHGKVRLGGRGRATLTFRTLYVQADEALPALVSADRALAMARLHSRVLTDSLGLSQSECATAVRLFGAAIWTQQPHQGAAQVLTLGVDALHEAGLTEPLILIAAATPQCAAIVAEAARAVGWLRLLGLPVTLCVLAQGDDAAVAIQTAQQTLAASPLRREGSVVLRAGKLRDGLRETIEAAVRLILYEDSDLATQLDALRTPIHDAISAETPLFPETEPLLFASALGGFQEQTGDCIRFGTQEKLPDEWCALLAGDRLILPMAGPRIQHSPGATVWRGAWQGLETVFTAADLTDVPASLRTLRIRNTGDQAQTLEVRYACSFRFQNGQLTRLTPLSGGVTAAHPSQAGIAWLSALEGDMTAEVWPRTAFQGLSEAAPAGLSAPASPGEYGSVGVLRQRLSLQAGTAATVTWLTGHADTADDIELALTHVRRMGASAAVRITRQRWTQRLARVSVSTPEPALDLLMNRILPMQTLQGHALDALPALVFLDPPAARDALLAGASDPRLPLLAAWYAAHTGDHSVFREPAGDSTLWEVILRPLTEVSLGASGLLLSDEGHESARRSMIYTAILRMLASYADAAQRADMLDMADRVAASLEASAWNGTYYADPLAPTCVDALTQAFAPFADLRRDRARQSLQHAWEQLYDPAHGLLRCRTPDPSDVLPKGFLDNGGHIASTAAWMTAALARCDLIGEAWTLARAMNPVHHTLTTEAAESFACAPDLLPGDMLAVPGEAGRAGDLDGTAGAAWLYAFTLEYLLGLRLRGNEVSFQSHVPQVWEQCSVSLQRNASTWRFKLSRTGENACDGEPLAQPAVLLLDDGRIHQVRLRFGA